MVNINVCYPTSNEFDVFQLAISCIEFIVQLIMMKILLLKEDKDKDLFIGRYPNTDGGSNRLASMHVE